MAQTSANVVAGADARASDFNKVVADLAEIYAGGPGVPVGAVIWWWSDNTVPLNYKVVDGSVVSDGASPLNGLTLPNLVDRFIRGVANANIRVSPTSGGQDDVTLSVGQLPVHTPVANSHSHAVSDPGHSHEIPGFMPNFNVSLSAFNINDFSGDRIAVADNANNGVNGNNITKGTGERVTNVTVNAATVTMQSIGSGESHTNIPAYRGLVPIMRIK